MLLRCTVQDFILTLAFVTFTFVFPVKIGQSRDKILHTLLACVLPSYDGS